MPRIEVDDRATTGVARLYRTLFMLTVLLFVVSPFADDIPNLVRLQQEGALDTGQLTQAFQVSIKLNRISILFHVLGCAGGVGLIMWQASRDDASTFLSAPLGAAILVGISAGLPRVVPNPELDAVTKVILDTMRETSPAMLDLAMTFGTAGQVETISVIGVFVVLMLMGFIIRNRIESQDSGIDAERGKRPEGWGKNS